MTAPIPITIVTGFLGSGKTTLLLNLIPQLQALNPSYKLALLKNEFGDLAIDSQLATSSSISTVTELLNGCICCNLVGSLSSALSELTTTQSPSRILIETSGSAFPATLAMEINRLAKETGGKYTLDGVVTVIDVENWKGYEDTSFTAKLQARFTDLVVFNKWEVAGERRMEECLDRLGDLEGVDVAWVKSDRGRVDVGLVFGIDGGLARSLQEEEDHGHGDGHDHKDGEKHEHQHNHQSEVEVLSITLSTSPSNANGTINTTSLSRLLTTAPKDEIYRIKAVLSSSTEILPSDPLPTPSTSSTPNSSTPTSSTPSPPQKYILNWAFGRWTSTPLLTSAGSEHESSSGQGIVLRMTIILARYESKKWKKRIEGGGFLELEGGEVGVLRVEKIG